MIILWLLAGMISKAAAAQAEVPRVLLLYSNDRLLPANLQVDEGFRNSLGQGTGETVELYTEFLDAVRFPGQERQDAMASSLRVRYQERAPNVLVSMGPEALNFFEERRDSLFPGTPLVFGGVGLQDKLPDPAGTDITGVPMSLDIVSTLEMALRIRPQTREVVVISGSALIDREWEARARAEFQPFESRVKMTYWNELPIAELTQRGSTLPPETVVVFLTYFQEPDGTHMRSSAHALELFAAKCSAPIFGPYDTYVGKGIVGGMMTDFFGEGKAVAELVQRVLDGETPQEIGLQPPRPGVYQFDARQLDRWNIQEKLLPINSTVTFRMPTLWSQYAPQVIIVLAVVVVQGWLIGRLLFQRRQRRRVEAELRESERRFRNMADTAPVMIWMSGVDRKCYYFNKRWLEFTGRTIKQELGDGWFANIHPEDIPKRVAGYHNAFDSRESFSVEYRLRHHDGEYRWILAQAVPRVRSDGEFLGYVGSCLDISDRKQVEEANRNLAHASRVSTLGQLAVTLAHELNQPLGAILRNAEAAELILKQNPPDYEEFSAILEDIRKDDQRAGIIIDRMRSFLKRREMEFESLSLKVLCEQVVQLLRSEMQTLRVEIKTVISGDLPPVRGDRVHLQQVLLNLLVNGADAMNGQSVGERRLIVRAAMPDNETVEVTVSDSGHGIPDEKLSRLFDPFFSTKSSGLGMGLAIVRTIVEAHGGRVRAENNAEGGAALRFTLPVVEVVTPT